MTHPDYINWDHVAPEFKYMARDGDGGNGEIYVYLYVDKPVLDDSDEEFMWFSGGKSGPCQHFASYCKGTVDWRHSLVERPAA